MSLKMLTPVVAYTSLTLPTHECDLELLRRWCSRIPIPLDILAEEIHPDQDSRPIWADILNQIERGTVTTLIVPSLFHIAGDNVIALSNVLTFLKAHGATLKSLAEVIDSRRTSRSEIILKLIENSQEKSEHRGAN